MFPGFLWTIILSKHVLSRVGQGFTHISAFVITTSGIQLHELLSLLYHERETVVSTCSILVMCLFEVLD